MLAVSASVLTQAAVCLIQVVLPFWVQFQIRLFITFSLAMIAALPAALAFALVYAAAGIELGFLAASAVAVLTGAGVLLLAAALFERLEMPS